MAAISSPGLGSGLDVNNLVSQLMAAERKAPTARLDSASTLNDARISALGKITSALDKLQTAAGTLASPNTFQTKTATVSDPSALSVTAARTAAAGSYTVEVSQLARADKLASASFNTAFETVGTGTLTISFGTWNSGSSTFTPNAAKPSTSIVIDATNNTLSGIRDAINAAGAGVTASIVGDGSGQRLVFSGSESGAANGLKISVSDNDGNSTDAGGLSQFAFDPAATAGSGRNLTQTVSAQDAKFKLDGLSLTSSTNLVGSAVSGLTLNLRTVTSSPVTVDIARDDSAAAKAVSGLVDAYNEVVSAVKSASSFDSESKKGGPLIGDASVLSVMGRLRGLMTSSIAGLGGVSSLKAVGVSFQKDGTLSFDSSTLADALSSNADSVARLFGATGKASDSRVSVVVSSSTTKTGNYAVDITTEPAGGLLTGAVTAPGFPLTIDGTNNGLSLLIDGTATGALTLTQGSYASADDLAHELQSRINGASALKTAGAAVTVSWNTDHFEIRSNRYGAASTVSLASGSAATALGLDTGTTTAGTDVAGTIGGVAATGSGRILTASGDADGLRLLISGAGTGARGSVDFKRGLGDQLKSLLDDVLADDGTIGRRSSGLSDESARIAKQRTALDDRMTELETRYRTQFTRLDSVMASLKATSDFLTSQLNAMTNSGSSSSSSN
ncbi:MAG TPA: flagellar filament capping protein FliD [Plasticicumulans sp.]|nr:flagellar filament capping protein FliD [Plasticicumulans sp.]